MATQDELSTQVAALMAVVAVLAKKAGVNPDEVAKFGDQATANVPEPRRAAIRSAISTMVSTYKSMP